MTNTKTAKSERKKQREVQIIADQNKQQRFRIRVLNSLIIVGSSIIFFSWLAQNYYQPQWLEEQMRLEKTQFLIQIEEGRADFWLNQLNQEVKREKRDNDLYMSAAINVINSTAKLFSWEKARVGNESQQSEAISEREQLIEKAHKALSEKDLFKLQEIFIILRERKSNLQHIHDEKFAEEFYSASSRAMFWRHFFIFSYIFGSALIGFRWYLLYIKGWNFKHVKPGEKLNQTFHLDEESSSLRPRQ
jgi:hypothetical protein